MNKEKNTNKNNTLRKWTSYASIFVAITLIIVKIIAYLMTGSIALFSSLIDSGVDLIASIITAFGVILATRPPDRRHRFGYGKAESLAALTQAGFITVSAIILIYKATTRFIEPTKIQNTEIGYIVMSIAIFLTIALLALQTYTINKTKSLAISSDRLHYIGDVFINLAVIATFAIQSSFNILWIDPFFAIIVGGILGVGAFKIGKTSLKILMDAELSNNDREKIIKIIKKVSGVKGVHDVRTRESNDIVIIEAHVEMNAKITLLDAHEITEAVETALLKKYKNADITIHQDPFGHQEERRDNLIEKNDPL